MNRKKTLKQYVMSVHSYAQRIHAYIVPTQTHKITLSVSHDTIEYVIKYVKIHIMKKQQQPT